MRLSHVVSSGLSAGSPHLHQPGSPHPWCKSAARTISPRQVTEISVDWLVRGQPASGPPSWGKKSGNLGPESSAVGSFSITADVSRPRARRPCRSAFRPRADVPVRRGRPPDVPIQLWRVSPAAGDAWEVPPLALPRACRCVLAPLHREGVSLGAWSAVVARCVVGSGCPRTGLWGSRRLVVRERPREGVQQVSARPFVGIGADVSCEFCSLEVL